jgi:protein-disulfide isomerase
MRPLRHEQNDGSVNTMIAFAYRNLFLCLVLAGFVAGASPAAAQSLSPSSSPAASMPKAERDKIESVVRDYILGNPEIIIEAIQSLRARDERNAREQAQANLAKLQDELLNDPDSPVGANLKGDVTFIEFFDYRCGFCKRAFPDIMKLMAGDKNIRFVYKEFPILGPDSTTASRAGLAAWILDKSKYEAFHKAMMASKGALPEARVMKYAVQSGYDVKALKKIMAEPRIDAMIAKTFKLAQALDINGTPAFIVGDDVVRGVVDLKTMKALVAKARAR